MVERLDTAKGLTPLRAAIEAAEAARSGIFQEVGESIIRKCRMELMFVKISQYPCGFDVAVVDFLGFFAFARLLGSGSSQPAQVRF